MAAIRMRQEKLFLKIWRERLSKGWRCAGRDIKKKVLDDHGVTVEYGEYVENASYSVDIDEHWYVNMCSRL